MSKLKIFFLAMVVALLAACGGGGGSAGITPGGGGSTPGANTGTVVVTTTPTLTIALVNGAGAATNSISAAGLISAKATVKDSSGRLVSGVKVTFTGDVTLIKISPASDVLTDSAGVATVQLSAASLNARGAGTLSAIAIIAGISTKSDINFQLSPANLTLSGLDTGTALGPLSAFGNRSISVIANIDGVAAIATPVQVSFSASCGKISPATATTDATGKASSTYSADNVACAGTNVVINATAVGATPLTSTVPVAASVATNVQFVSTTPQLIYLKDSVGTTQAQVVFKAVDSIGNPLQNKKMRLQLSNTATGVSLNTVGNILPVELTTDEAGLVSAAVFSGTVPTSLNVRATLLDNSGAVTAVFTNSNLLTVASGRPTQSALSLALGSLSIEGLNTDGATTTVSISMADRQGNPVPPGTQVNFVAESGTLLPAVCFVPPAVPANADSPAIPISSCNVVIRSSGTRPANGRVSILAYTSGEEDFVDVNGNNLYDTGEPFTDLGRAFRDDNGQAATGANGVYDSGEFQVPRIATPACVPGLGCRGDTVWGAADVRQQTTLVFASGNANATAEFRNRIEPNQPSSPSIPPFSTSTVVSGFTMTIADDLGNSVPTGSVVTISPKDNTPNTPATVTSSGALNIGICSLTGPGSITIPNTSNRFVLNVGLNNCTRTDVINVVITTPRGFVSSRDFVIPE